MKFQHSVCNKQNIFKQRLCKSSAAYVYTATFASYHIYNHSTCKYQQTMFIINHIIPEIELFKYKK